MKCAYCTLVSNDDYVTGAMCLSVSYKKINSKYPFIILVSSDVSNECVEKLNTYGIVRIIENKTYDNAGNHYYRFTRQKLEVFNQCDFDRIAFIDADSLLINNIDDCLDNNNFLFYDRHNFYPQEFEEKTLCGEFFIVSPNKYIYDYLDKHANDDGIWQDETNLRLLCDESLEFINEGNFFDKVIHLCNCKLKGIDEKIKKLNCDKCKKYWMCYDLNDDNVGLFVDNILNSYKENILL